MNRLRNYLRNRSWPAIAGDVLVHEQTLLVAIIVNAVLIFAMAFPRMQGTRWLVHFDNFFVVYFALEAAVKIKRLGWRNYWRVGWNQFDGVIVLASLPLLLEPFIPLTGSAHVVTMFRLFRVIRLVRFFQFVPNLQHILMGLGRAFRASVFVLIMLIVLNLIFAVLTTYLFAETLPEYFSDPVQSAFTVFQMFTLEGWNDIPAAIAQQTDWPLWQVNLARFYFAAIVLLGGIFGMSLANAIFVDEMTMDNNAELEQKIDNLQAQLTRIEALLQQQDRDDN